MTTISLTPATQGTASLYPPVSNRDATPGTSPAVAAAGNQVMNADVGIVDAPAPRNLLYQSALLNGPDGTCLRGEIEKVRI